jgi:hypothetical protein
MLSATHPERGRICCEFLLRVDPNGPVDPMYQVCPHVFLNGSM